MFSRDESANEGHRTLVSCPWPVPAPQRLQNTPTLQRELPPALLQDTGLQNTPTLQPEQPLLCAKEIAISSSPKFPDCLEVLTSNSYICLCKPILAMNFLFSRKSPVRGVSHPVIKSGRDTPDLSKTPGLKWCSSRTILTNISGTRFNIAWSILAVGPRIEPFCDDLQSPRLRNLSYTNSS
ncbi:unnamed protein product [Caretta caretta]